MKLFTSLFNMYYSIDGLFVAKSPTKLVIDNHGMGYEIQISLYTYSQIQDKDRGALYIYLHINDNAHTLYGFNTLEEKELFLQLISVSGVGASTARMMLSGMQPNELIKAITHQQVKELEKIKGIGKKTAERLIVELRDKLQKSITMPTTPWVGKQENNIKADAIQALMALGISKADADRSVQKALSTIGDQFTLEHLVKVSLQYI